MGTEAIGTEDATGAVALAGNATAPGQSCRSARQMPSRTSQMWSATSPWASRCTATATAAAAVGASIKQNAFPWASSTH